MNNERAWQLVFRRAPDRRIELVDVGTETWDFGSCPAIASCTTWDAARAAMRLLSGNASEGFAYDLTTSAVEARKAAQRTDLLAKGYRDDELCWRPPSGEGPFDAVAFMQANPDAKPRHVTRFAAAYEKARLGMWTVTEAGWTRKYGLQVRGHTFVPMDGSVPVSPRAELEWDRGMAEWEARKVTKKKDAEGAS